MEEARRELCSICLEALSNPVVGDNGLLSTPCQHFFHRHCLWDWITRGVPGDCCPFCKRQLQCTDPVLVSFEQFVRSRSGAMAPAPPSRPLGTTSTSHHNAHPSQPAFASHQHQDHRSCPHAGLGAYPHHHHHVQHDIPRAPNNAHRHHHHQMPPMQLVHQQHRNLGNNLRQEMQYVMNEMRHTMHQMQHTQRTTMRQAMSDLQHAMQDMHQAIGNVQSHFRNHQGN